MVLVVWCPSGAALLSCHDCALSQIGAHPGVTLNVARMYTTTNKQPHTYCPTTVFVVLRTSNI